MIDSTVYFWRFCFATEVDEWRVKMLKTKAPLDANLTHPSICLHACTDALLAPQSPPIITGRSSRPGRANRRAQLDPLVAVVCPHPGSSAAPPARRLGRVLL